MIMTTTSRPRRLGVVAISASSDYVNDGQGFLCEWVEDDESQNCHSETVWRHQQAYNGPLFRQDRNHARPFAYLCDAHYRMLGGSDGDYNK